MKKFMAIYTGNPDAFARYQRENPDPEKRKSLEEKGMNAWIAWGKAHETSIADHGAPLGKTKRVTAGGVQDIRNQMAGYTIVEAESHEAAAKMFLDHPHFSIFPGDGVEIMECLPMPEMPK